MKMSNDGQYEKAKKEYGKDFYSKEGSSADSGLEKDATTMEKGSVKAGRFATGGALRQPRDGNMRFASGGFPKKPAKKNPFGKKPPAAPMPDGDADDAMLAPASPFPKKPKTGGAMATAEDATMTSKFPRNKAAKFAFGGKVKAVKRNMGGMMGLDDPQVMGARDAFNNNPGLRGPGAPRMPGPPDMGRLGQMRQGIGAPPPAPMPPPAPQSGGASPPMAPQMDPGAMNTRGEFRRGGAAKPVKLAMGGVGKQRHNAMSKSGSPMMPKKASKAEQVI